MRLTLYLNYLPFLVRKFVYKKNAFSIFKFKKSLNLLNQAENRLIKSEESVILRS